MILFWLCRFHCNRIPRLYFGLVYLTPIVFGAYTSALPFSLQFTSALILWPRQCGFNRLRRSLRSVKEQIYVESQGLEKSDTKGFLSKSKFSKNRNMPTQNNISKQLLVGKNKFSNRMTGEEQRTSGSYVLAHKLLRVDSRSAHFAINLIVSFAIGSQLTSIKFRSHSLAFSSLH